MAADAPMCRLGAAPVGTSRRGATAGQHLCARKRPMTLTELRYLLAIVDADLNISAAAQRVHGTQPSLSRSLKQLEDELGFQVFTRHGRSLADITPAGREVVEIARDRKSTR